MCCTFSPILNHLIPHAHSYPYDMNIKDNLGTVIAFCYLSTFIALYRACILFQHALTMFNTSEKFIWLIAQKTSRHLNEIKLHVYEYATIKRALNFKEFWISEVNLQKLFSDAPSKFARRTHLLDFTCNRCHRSRLLQSRSIWAQAHQRAHRGHPLRRTIHYSSKLRSLRAAD